MPHPKKEKLPMCYYIMINKTTMEYFVNKSTHPRTSVRHHFNRAKNPNRADYNSDFSIAIRTYGEEGFDISYSLEVPEWMIRRAHYMPAIPDLTIEQMRGNYTPKYGTKDEYGESALVQQQAQQAAIKRGEKPY